MSVHRISKRGISEKQKVSRLGQYGLFTLREAATEERVAPAKLGKE